MLVKIGHRGAAGYEPENTLLSFNKALQLNIDYIELDVQVCSTGQVLAMHDAKVDRTTNGTGYIQEKTFQELRLLDAGKGQKIPTLQEVLDLIDKKTKINIEIKGDGAAKAIFSILQHYIQEKGWKWNDFLISSFNHYELAAFNKLTSNVRIGAVVAGIPIGYAECAEKLKAYSIHLSKEFINKNMVDDAHKRGLKVFVYTLNDPDDIEKMRVLGIDGLFSNFPDRI